jgi:Spy/CpxP family protein refolding chaperone
MNDPFGDAMFPPDLIMQHTRDLGLTDEQKAYMRGEIQKTTTRFNELQWQLQDSMEALHATIKANPVNEQLALSQLDKVLDTEREIKRLHFGLVISIKNKLTPEQQEKLHGMMRMMHGPGPDGPERGRGPGGPGPGPGGPPPNRPEGEPFM